MAVEIELDAEWMSKAACRRSRLAVWEAEAVTWLLPSREAQRANGRPASSLSGRECSLAALCHSIQ